MAIKMLLPLRDIEEYRFMSKLKEAFKDGKTFIPFITGGDPDLDTTKKLILEMQKNGADIIEVGIPFSDPIAESLVIQEADFRALHNGCTTDKLFHAIKEIRDEIKIPLVFVTYINVIYKYGKMKFMEKCKECGVCGVIVPDCPYEEREEIMPECKALGIDFVSIIAPTSHDRIKIIAEDSQGFLYCISSLGAAESDTEAIKEIGSMVNHVREVTDNPCAVGGGISTPKQAKKMAQYADGIIMGTEIVSIIAEYGRESVYYVGKYIKEMKSAIQS